MCGDWDDGNGPVILVYINFSITLFFFFCLFVLVLVGTGEKWGLKKFLIWMHLQNLMIMPGPQNWVVLCYAKRGEVPWCLLLLAEGEPFLEMWGIVQCSLQEII